ncbi:MAG TPA: hypothetical protein VKE49_10450 [Myxococcaceae bacterium]|nr:hypothetical protein [Myxococcaceae bacterium]
MSDPSQSRALAGLTGVTVNPPERVQVRSRLSNVTRAAWRIDVASDQGPGSITVVEISPNEQYYRGDGTFLGWNQEQLAAAYRDLLPQSGDAGPESPQLG